MKKKLIASVLALTMCFSIGGTIASCSDGKNGKSAYELWLELDGNEGKTIEEFFASLKGDKGDKGDQGEQGVQGDKGETGAQGPQGEKGEQGEQGETGAPGKDGVDGAPGKDGVDGEDGAPGKDGVDGEDGAPGKDGADGLTPFVGENGNWWIGDIDTGVKAEGKDGVDGAPGKDGVDGEDGKDGEDGVDGLTPYVGENGNWWIGETDTGVKAVGKDGVDGEDGKDGADGEDGKDGVDGLTPYVGENGNWWIGETDTGVKAVGIDGANGNGIEWIKFNDEGTALLVKYTNSETPVEIPLPVKAECTHENSERVVIVEHTCNEENVVTNGTYIYVCNDCGFSKVAYEAAHVYGEEKVVVDPTCTEAGYEAYVCTICDYVNEEGKKDLPATGHCGKEKMFPATCTENAYIEEWCLWCDYENTRVLNDTKLGHNWSEETPVYEEGAYICTSPYMTVKTCDRCNLVDATVEQPVGCTVVAWNVEKATAPTFEATGLLTGNCKYCKEEMTVVLPKLDATAYAYTESDAKGPCTERTGFDLYEIWVDAQGNLFTANAEGLTKYEVKVPLVDVAHTVTKNGETAEMNLEFYYVEDWSGIITEILGYYSDCANAGKGIYKCVECGETVEVVTYRKHVLGNLIEDKAASCTEAGYGHKDCANCDYVEENIVIDQLAHDFKYEIKNTDDGLMLKKSCKTCTTNWEATKVETYDVNTQAATCVAEGSVTYTCTVKNETTGAMETLTFAEVLPKTAHTLKGELLPAPNKAADGTEFYYMDDWTGYITEIQGNYSTCEDYGYGVYKCEHKDCGATIDVKTLRKHTYATKEQTKAPTCTEAGEYTFSCSVCGAKDQKEAIPELGHTPAYKLAKEEGKFYFVTTCSVCGVETNKEEVTTFVTKDTSKATCKDAKPVIVYNYVEAGKTYSVVEPVEKVPHQLNKEDMTAESYPLDGKRNITVILGKEPTCTKEGEGVYVCDVCNGLISVKLSKTAHNYEVDTFEDATCTTAGLKTGKCVDCGATDPVVIEAKGHKYVLEVVWDANYVNGKVIVSCSVCNVNKELALPELANEAYETKVTVEDTCEVAGEIEYKLNLNEFFNFGNNVLGYEEKEMPELIAVFYVPVDVNTHDYEETVYTWTVEVGEKVFEYTGRYCSDCEQMVVINVEDVTPAAPVAPLE